VDSGKKVGTVAAAPATPPPPPAPFDVAKFAGIFAAIGLALGAIGSALAAVLSGFFSLVWWQWPIAIAGLVLVRSRESGREYREEAVLPLHYVVAAGPVSRGDFNRMLGLGERTGRKVIAQLLKDGLLVSDTPKGEVRIGFPLDALNILLPNLYPEAGSGVAQ